MLNRVSIVPSNPSTARIKPRVAFLDQVLQVQSFTQISTCDVHHQAKIGLDHVLTCKWIALGNSFSEFALFALPRAVAYR